MRLSKKDKAWLADLVKTAVVDALTVEIQWEKVKDDETGVPLATPEYRIENVFLPSYFSQHLKFHEGAFRGQQETFDHVKNNLKNLDKRVGVMGQSFLTLQEPMVLLERFVGLLVKSGIMDRMEDAIPAGPTGQELKKIDGETENAGDNR